MSNYTVLILDTEIEVDVVYFYGGSPARLNALPEDCYPEEGAEIDWTYCDSVSEFAQESIENNDKWQESISDQLMDIMINQDPDDRY